MIDVGPIEGIRHFAILIGRGQRFVRLRVKSKVEDSARAGDRSIHPIDAIAVDSRLYVITVSTVCAIRHPAKIVEAVWRIVSDKRLRRSRDERGLRSRAWK